MACTQRHTYTTRQKQAPQRLTEYINTFASQSRACLLRSCAHFRCGSGEAVRKWQVSKSNVLKVLNPKDFLSHPDFAYHDAEILRLASADPGRASGKFISLPEDQALAGLKLIQTPLPRPAECCSLGTGFPSECMSLSFNYNGFMQCCNECNTKTEQIHASCHAWLVAR